MLVLMMMAMLAADAAPPGRTVITNPEWARRPSAEDLGRVWPSEAVRRQIGGHAEIKCVVTKQGALRDCIVLEESPPGAGFGDAALLLAPQFQMRPMTVDGEPVDGGSVKIPFNFSKPPTGLGREMTTVVHLPWLEAPVYADVLEAYPAEARAAKAGGRVVLECRIGANDRLGDCTALDSPKDHGFVQAAETLSKKFLAPAKLDGKSLANDRTQILFIFAPQMLADGPPVVGKPEWAQLPDAVDVAAGYPAEALAAHVAVGHVTLDCAVGLGGRLQDCAIATQNPDGLGFGRAALALSKQFRVSPWTEEGLPTGGGRITVPIRFEAPAPNAKP
jgi:TonB family protein